MRSGNRPALLIGVAAAGVAVVGVLTGCQTTQDAAARVQLRNERDLVARKPVKVGHESPDVRVVDASIVSADGKAAIAVQLENTSSHPVNDLPIEVGVGGDVLNDGKEVPYFETHAPALDPGQKATWVYVAKDELKGSDKAFAHVGASPSNSELTQAESLPTVTADPAADGKTVAVTNSSGFTQYDVAVYEVARDGDRIVAAGQADAGDLESGDSKDVTVKLIGSPKGAQLQAAAPPTIFK